MSIVDEIHASVMKFVLVRYGFIPKLEVFCAGPSHLVAEFHETIPAIVCAELTSFVQEGIPEHIQFEIREHPLAARAIWIRK